MRYIKCRAEFVLPVPHEVGDDLDAVAEAGLEVLRGLISNNVHRMQPGTLYTSWQSMPKSWQPQRSNIVLAEPISPSLTHTVDADDRIGFVEEGGVTHPWDQGLWIFPPDHPLHNVERPYREHYLDPRYKDHLRPQLKEAVAELTEGDDDDDN